MYYHETYQPKIRLWNRQGSFWEYENIKDAADKIPYRIKSQIGGDFKDPRRIFFRSAILQPLNELLPHYVLRTEFNEPVRPNDLYDNVRRGPFYTWITFPRRIYPGFRNGPVPWTGKRHWRSHMRHMRTTQEIRENTMFVNDRELREYGIKIRGKRMNLPTVWDDYWIYYTKNWKKHRKHQWKI